MQITQRHHGYACTHQRVIGVVPFGALGIHPNPTTRYKIGQLGERHSKQLLQ